MQEMTPSTELMSNETEEDEYINIKEYGVAPRLREKQGIYENGYLNCIARIGCAIGNQMNDDFVAELTAQTPAKNIINGSENTVMNIKNGLKILIENGYGLIPDYVHILIHPDKLSELRNKYNIIRDFFDYTTVDIFKRDDVVVTSGLDFIVSQKIPKNEIRIIDTSIPSIVFYDRESLKFSEDSVARLRVMDLIAWIRFVFVVEFPDACVCIKAAQK